MAKKQTTNTSSKKTHKKQEKINEEKIKQILLSENYVTADDIKAAEDFSKAHRGSTLDYLFVQGLITKDLLGQAVAEFFKMPYADLNSHPPGRDQVLLIPETIAKNLRVVVFSQEDNKLTVSTDNPFAKDKILLKLKKVFPGKKITLAYSLPEDIEAAFVHYRKPLETRFAKILKRHQRVAPEIIEEIFADALTFRASDIHFEPQEKEVVVRFRIDGVLREAGRIPKKHYENILNRIKVQAHLRIDEHLAAQDGAIRYFHKNNPIDMRISIAPTIDGEKITIRLLSQYVRSFTLGDLGLSPHDQQLIEEASKKPFGMILVTGPTGSGKSTTLYALLKILNRPEVNITTIEDPVEYKIAGINQIQVNPRTNLTFAQGLRSIVRQDPDIILVGEIRDKETAEISVNAALTGHLLLSTFHANDAATAIPRLLDMGIEPFLLASTLEIVVGQRLVRKICESCRYSLSARDIDLAKILPDYKYYFPQDDFTLYQGKGCKSCGGSGFSGRTAIFEFVKNTPEMQELILQNPSSRQIWELARKQGSRTFFEDGIDKVKNGITTLSELMRVAAPPNILKSYNK